MTSLTDLGEYQIVNWLQSIIPDAPCMAFPIGNDCAGLKIPPDVDLLINTDGVASSLLRQVTPENGRYVGRFCVTHVLSDIVCMGGKPVAFLSNLHMTRDTPIEYLQALVLELESSLRMYDTYTIGGDVKETDARAVVGIALGFVEKGKALTRSGAKVGNLLAVTMTEGRPLGFRWAHEVNTCLGLSSGKSIAKELEAARFDYLRLPIKEMQIAFRTGALTSGMDTSDGILACVQHIESMSQVGCLLYEEALGQIVDQRLLPLADELSINPVKFALNAGYDWESVCTIERSRVAEVQARVREVGGDLAIIGEITSNLLSTMIKTLKDELLPIKIFADEKFMPPERHDPMKTWLETRLY